MGSNRTRVVFLSHNSIDKPAVEEIRRQLESGRPRFRCWFDQNDLRSRSTWMIQIEEVLAECESAVLFFGPHGRGPIHELERQKLIDRAARNRDSFWLVPVLLPGTTKDDVDGFTTLFNWVNFNDGLDSPAAIERLRRLLRGEAPGSLSLDDQVTGDPYRGLERYEGRHAEFFFGRDAEIRELCDCVKNWPFVAIIGGSGSGKSSLARAGLHTTLAIQQLPLLEQAVRIDVLPGANPLRALADQIAMRVASSTRKDPESLSDTFEKRFMRRPDGLLTLLTSRFPRDDQFVLLLIDQFEELFTHDRNLESSSPGREAVERFVELLQTVAASRLDRFRIVITLRADFLSRCLEMPQLVSLVQNRTLLLGELSPQAIHEVIVRPVQQIGAYFEKGLVSRIVADVEGQSGSLPLLQHALKELWNQRHGRWLTNEAYDNTGGVAGALSKRADETLAWFSPEQRQIAKSIFLRLTMPGEGVGDTRRRVLLKELYPADPKTHPAVAEVIDKLRSKEARLIVTNDDGTAEVTHEALIQRWAQLQSWLNTGRDEKRLHDRLRDAARAWLETCADDSTRRDPSYLWDGARLDEALQLDRQHPAILNDLEKSFIEASAANRKIEEDRWRRAYQVSLVRQLAAQAQVILGTEGPELTDRGLLLGIESLRRCIDLSISSLEADQALRRGLAITARRINQVAASAKVQREAICVHPTKAIVAYGQEDGQTWYWNLATGSCEPGPQLRSSVTCMAISPNGQWLAIGAIDGTFQLIAAETGTPHSLQLPAMSEPVRAICFCNKSQHLAVAFHNQIAVWDLAASGDPTWLQHTTQMAVGSLTFGQEGAVLFAQGSASDTLGWKWQTQELISKIERMGTHVAHSPDGRFLAVGSSRNFALLMCDTATSIVWELANNCAKVIFSADGRFAAMASPEHFSRVWKLPSFEVVQNFRHNAEVWDLDFSPNGTYLVTGAKNNVARVWNTETGEEVARLVHSDHLTSSRFLGDSRHVLTLSGNSVLTIWDTQELREVRQLQHHVAVLGVAFSPEGRLLATLARESLVGRAPLLIDLANQQQVKELQPQDGDVISGTEYAKKLLDEHRVNSRSQVRDPNGHWVAVSDGTDVQILDVEQNQQVRFILHHERTVVAMVACPDGQHIVTTSDHDTGRIWNVWSGQEVSRLTHDNPQVTDVDFSPDGRYVATASWDGTARVWLWRSNDLVREASTRVSRDLSDKEWNKYLSGETYRSTRTTDV